MTQMTLTPSEISRLIAREFVRRENARKYSREKYHNDHEFRERQIEKQRKINERKREEGTPSYYEKNLDLIKMKRTYNSYRTMGNLQTWLHKFPEDYSLLIDKRYILPNLTRNPLTIRTRVS